MKSPHATIVPVLLALLCGCTAARARPDGSGADSAGMHPDGDGSDERTTSAEALRQRVAARGGTLRVACLGDSNTASDWQHRKDPSFERGHGWCEQLADHLGALVVEVDNRASAGARAVARPPHQLRGSRLILSGPDQLAAALAAGPPDVVLIAFVTNDLHPSDPQPSEEIIATLLELAVAAEERGVLAFLATAPMLRPHATPGRWSPEPAAIKLINDRIREEVPATRRLDFDRSPRADNYLDVIHLNAAGHTLRAREAARAIRAALGMAQESRDPPARSGRAAPPTTTSPAGQH